MSEYWIPDAIFPPQVPEVDLNALFSDLPAGRVLYGYALAVLLLPEDRQAAFDSAAGESVLQSLMLKRLGDGLLPIPRLQNACPAWLIAVTDRSSREKPPLGDPPIAQLSTAA